MVTCYFLYSWNSAFFLGGGVFFSCYNFIHVSMRFIFRTKGNSASPIAPTCWLSIALRGIPRSKAQQWHLPSPWNAVGPVSPLDPPGLRVQGAFPPPDDHYCAIGLFAVSVHPVTGDPMRQVKEMLDWPLAWSGFLPGCGISHQIRKQLSYPQDLLCFVFLFLAYANMCIYCVSMGYLILVFRTDNCIFACEIL